MLDVLRQVACTRWSVTQTGMYNIKGVQTVEGKKQFDMAVMKWLNPPFGEGWVEIQNC